MIKDLTDYPVIIEMPVNWGEMDAFSHVSNVIYFKYFESVRIAYLEKLNCLSIVKKTNIGIILASIQAKFITPLFYPDAIKVGAKISVVNNDNFIMDYAIYSTAQNKIAAIGNSTVVTYDYKKKCKADIPQEFLEAMSMANVNI